MKEPVPGSLEGVCSVAGMVPCSTLGCHRCRIIAGALHSRGMSSRWHRSGGKDASYCLLVDSDEGGLWTLAESEVPTVFWALFPLPGHPCCTALSLGPWATVSPSAVPAQCSGKMGRGQQGRTGQWTLHSGFSKDLNRRSVDAALEESTGLPTLGGQTSGLSPEGSMGAQPRVLSGHSPPRRALPLALAQISPSVPEILTEVGCDCGVPVCLSASFLTG